jgi:hypothetical protein
MLDGTLLRHYYPSYMPHEYYAKSRVVEHFKKAVSMKRLPVFLTLATAIFALASCEKEAEQIESSVDAAAVTSNAVKPDLLTAGNWRQTGLTVSSATAGSNKLESADLFSHLKSSMIDKSVHYSVVGAYSVAKGARPGSEAVAVPVNGTWKLSEAGDSLHLTLPSGTRHLGVAELTANTLRLVYADAAADGSVSTYTSVYSH